MSRGNIPGKAQLNAVNFRVLLSVSILVIIVVTAFGFSYAHQLLGVYADEIAHKKVDAASSNNTISSLQKIEQTMQENQGLIDKIDKLRGHSSFPEFMIVKEVKAIAKRNDISISSFTFGSSSDSSSASGGQAQPTTTEQPSASSGAPSDTVSLTINFGSVPSYRKYLQFLYDIEQNVPKMRIQGAGVSDGGSSSSTTDTNGGEQPTSTGGVSVDPLVVEMYIK